MAPASTLPRDAVRVRMYRVGFGDCFLVSFPVGDAARHVLFDCGVHPSGDIGTMSAVLDNVEAETEGRLAAVVATHEHADHVSGYGAFASRFARFEIDEIWMPWAMDPEDPVAVDLRPRRLALADFLAAHFDASRSSGGDSPAVRAILANLRGNDRALQALRSRFDGAARRIRYLKAGQRLPASARQPDPVGIDGLVVKVQGPPTDPEFLRRMEPPASQRYLARTRDRAHSGPRGAAVPEGPRDRARGGPVALSLEPPGGGEFRRGIRGSSGRAGLRPRFRGEQHEPRAAPVLPRTGAALPRRRPVGQLEVLDRVAGGHGAAGAGGVPEGGPPRQLQRHPPRARSSRCERAGSRPSCPPQSTPWPSIPREPLMARADEAEPTTAC